ncbi:MAG: DUF366 domain-containing protein [Deltaproteobacteria bacterium CG_4_10_14_0_2_um_filter_43_8]|nr:MAG: hypothetical protein COV43_04250 [Deltaproteobacteria bacterium CG11_big_fil_rev_8_21_14_0_20_42_23]PJA19216.1 MAG: DUF366 domain-containing protein [Deltaproteobacteria bacterium CG_4_10_14_0_2_um_filter_43_8]PJC64482.1 MAG: DUF366 domain-containing protein [Deltaproteobacteria bacterium CG_4_9_14_0_2_um_filter_42_21]
MKHAFLTQKITYTGLELRSGWIAEHAKLEGDAIAAFIGPANVPIEHMVDLEDVAANAPIYSPLMLHFLVEHFDLNMNLAAARQRLLVLLACEALGQKGIHPLRKGDDIFVKGKKLSVSIAAPAPESTCIHFALNIDTEGTPVPTSGLRDLSVEASSFAEELMTAYVREIAEMKHSTQKVKRLQ